MNHNPDSTTHYACQARIAKEGGEAKCCQCEPHDDCKKDITVKMEKTKEEWLAWAENEIKEYQEFIDFLKSE